MSKLQTYIDNLAQLDLSKYPYEEVKTILLKAFKEMGMINHTLHKTYRMARLRRNVGDQKFSSVSDLSYKPDNICSNYQRASIPGNSLFYAASCKRRDVLSRPFTDEEYGIKVAVFETLPELRENCYYGSGKYDPSEALKPFKIKTPKSIENIVVTYGIWEVTIDVGLAKVCYNRVYDMEHAQYYLQQHIFGDYVMASPEKRINQDIFLNYLSREFSKLGVLCHKEYDYMVSAIATQILCERGYHGVSYPSSRCEVFGINFAISSQVVDSSLKCVEVGLVRLQNQEGYIGFEYLGKKQLHNGEINFVL